MHMIECKAQRLELLKSNHSKMPVFNEGRERWDAAGEALSDGSIYLSEVHN